jgi:hypothetical protein
MVTHCHEAVDVHKNILILSQLLGFKVIVVVMSHQFPH